jgi:hypothetical protein
MGWKMIPSAFSYYRPSKVDEAVGLMANLGEDARVIAGGHSLIPIMKQRLTDIKHLIDLSGIDEIRGIQIKNNVVSIGAMTTQVELINNEELFKEAPIIREASLQIADPQVRNLGTIGGNVANGDPANDMPGLMQLLDATYKLSGVNGSREVKARDFYEGAYFTSREDDEILISISFESPSGGYAYEKQKRKIVEKKGWVLVDPGSQAGLDSSMAKAAQRGQNWFGYYWAPTAPIGKYKMKLMDFGVPFAGKDNWDGCIAKGPEGCSDPKPSAWTESVVQTIVTSEIKAMPEVMSYFGKRIYPGPIMNGMLVYMQDNQSTGPDAAIEFLEKHEDVWTKWVSSDVAAKVKKAL